MTVADPHAATPTDLRLLGPAAGVWLAAFIGLGVAPRSSGIAAGGLALSGLICLARVGAARARRVGAGRADAARAGVVAASLILGAASFAGAGLRVAGLHSPALMTLVTQQAEVSADAVVTGDPRVLAPAVDGSARREPVTAVGVRLERVTARGRTVRLRVPATVLATTGDWQTLVPGQHLTVSGRLTAGRDPSTAASLRARGSPVRHGRPPALQRGAQSLRLGLRRATAGLSPGPRGLIPGLVVGDTSALPPELSDDFRTVGLTHLTAVSGANVAILLGVLLIILRRIGVRGRLLHVSAAVSLLGFVVLARPSPSVLRAAAMGAVLLVAVATGRRQRGVPSLCVAVLLLVLADPWQARSYGFVLSVLATGALLLLAPALTTALTRRGWPLRLSQLLAVPVSACMVTAPVTVMLSGQVSLVAVPANMLAEPAVAPATVLGMLATVLSAVSAPLASWVARLAGLPAAWIVAVARRGATVSSGSVSWPASAFGACTLAATTIGLAALAPWVLRRPRLRRLSGATAAGALVATVLAPPGFVGLGAWPPPHWAVVACDVGQGDALVLDGGAAGAVVVDTGPDPEAIDGCLRRLGISRVALVVLTHLHADHVEGLPGVLAGRAVAEIEVGPLDEPPDEARRVATWADAASVPLRRVTFGETRSAGPLQWRVLAPTPGAPDTGPNDASVVLLARVGAISLLLTGDVEPPAQHLLAQAMADIGVRTVDVLKVPHHGSSHQFPQFLASLQPRVALISVGAHNTYGHPAAATLGLLDGLGAVIGRTDRDGDLAVTSTGGALRLVRRSGHGPG